MAKRRSTKKAKELGLADMPIDMILEVCKHLDTPDIARIYATCKFFSNEFVLAKMHLQQCRFCDDLVSSFDEVLDKITDSIRPDDGPFQHSKSLYYKSGSCESNVYMRLHRMQWGHEYRYKVHFYNGVHEICVIEPSHQTFMGLIHIRPVSMLFDYVEIPMVLIYIGCLFVAQMNDYGFFTIVKSGRFEMTSKYNWFWNLIEHAPANPAHERKLYKDIVYNAI